jgi:hypothetical protein
MIAYKVADWRIDGGLHIDADALLPKQFINGAGGFGGEKLSVRIRPFVFDCASHVDRPRG